MERGRLLHCIDLRLREDAAKDTADEIDRAKDIQQQAGVPAGALVYTHTHVLAHPGRFQTCEILTPSYPRTVEAAQAKMKAIFPIRTMS